MRATEFGVTPLDLERMTISQLELYAEKPKLTAAEAFERARTQTKGRQRKLSAHEYRETLRRLYPEGLS